MKPADADDSCEAWDGQPNEMCIAVFAPYGQDAALLAQTLASKEVETRLLADVGAFCEALTGCAAGLLTTDALNSESIDTLRRTLQEQPAWSDVPLILLANRIDAASYSLLADALGNVTIIQRPLDASSLMTIVRTVLRARRKQYEVRDLLFAEERQASEIRALTDRLLMALDAAAMGNWDVDLMNDRRRESASVGPMFGNEPKEAIITQAEWMARIHLDDQVVVQERWQAAMNGHGDYSAEYRTMSSPPRWMASRGSFIRDESGKAIQATGVLMDVTERMQAEQELRRRQQEIEELNQQLRRAMTETHHRVKNSLQLIHAFVEFRAEEHKDLVPVAELKHVNTQVSILAAVHDVLTQETHQGTAEFISAKTLLEKLLPMIASISGPKRIQFHIDELRLPSRQGTSLALIANELILNAMKHSGNEVELNLKVESDCARLIVSDDGKGLPKDFSVSTSSNVGLGLVENLARWDLKGETVYGNRKDRSGARIEVQFPASFALNQKMSLTG